MIFLLHYIWAENKKSTVQPLRSFQHKNAKAGGQNCVSVIHLFDGTLKSEKRKKEFVYQSKIESYLPLLTGVYFEMCNNKYR